MIIRNRDVVEIDIAVPEGHKHLRTAIVLENGSEIILQEATVANIVRAYISIKTHPQISSCRLIGQEVGSGSKEGFADWQLLEEER